MTISIMAISIMGMTVRWRSLGGDVEQSAAALHQQRQDGLALLESLLQRAALAEDALPSPAPAIAGLLVKFG